MTAGLTELLHLLFEVLLPALQRGSKFSVLVIERLITLLHLVEALFAQPSSA